MAIWWGYVQTVQMQVVQFEASGFVPIDGFSSPPPTLLNGQPVPAAALIVTKTPSGLMATVDESKLLQILGPQQYLLLWNK